MGNRLLEFLLWLVWGMSLTGSAPFVSGAVCEEITVEPCTSLPYTQTGFPNSLGHTSSDQIPPQLSPAFETLIHLGCYDNLHLFLCAAAFPQCTTSGLLLSPCRSLCESAMSGCGFWFNFYSDLFDNIDCEAMPNSTDSSICVGLNTTPSPVVTNNRPPENTNSTTTFEVTTGRKMTNSTRAVGTQNAEVYSSETLFATPLSRQPSTTQFSEKGENSSKEHQDGKTANSTSLNVDFTGVSEVIGQRATESKEGRKITDSLDKSVKANTDSQGRSTLPGLGIALTVVSCVGLVVLLISCAFFRKAFGKPFGGSRRKPRDGAFYTNPAFNDLPQSPATRNVNGQSLSLQQQPYTLEDLPPHPAGMEARPHHHRHAEPNIYQQEPSGFIEQNLFAVPQFSHDHPTEMAHQKSSDASIETEGSGFAAGSNRITSDLVYTNKVTSAAMDANANEHGAANECGGSDTTSVAPSGGKTLPVVSTNMDDGDMVIANPTAC